MKCIFTIFALSICFSLVAQGDFDTVRIRPVKVTDQIYMLKGSGGNIGVLIGKEGVLMVDDQFAPLSNKINGAIKTLDPSEIRFLVNTHLHGDHSGGNENFKRMGVTVVAHDMARERMSTEKVNPSTKEVTPPRHKDALPVITFAD
ncbi:MAG: MBL fold metallo-hydrolase, partial [Marivirga sp.]|nr:MBL fold metallo-hydrolase [Marivirga sp.]